MRKSTIKTFEKCLAMWVEAINKPCEQSFEEVLDKFSEKIKWQEESGRHISKLLIKFCFDLKQLKNGDFKKRDSLKKRAILLKTYLQGRSTLIADFTNLLTCAAECHLSEKVTNGLI